MASRRDELNAYSYARRRTVASFLRPSPHGSEEAAPRPLKTILPSLGVAALVLVGFGGWGMLSPTAPKGWDDPGAKVLVGDESTTRYVLVRTKGEKKVSLHPVLNLASARLLLKPDKFEVVKVKESVLDKSKYPMGATVGIPFAPDRLPSADDAETPKIWSVCEAPTSGGDSGSRRAVYVLEKGDYDKLLHRGHHELKERQAIFVEGPGRSGEPGPQYMVTSDGRAFLMKGAGLAQSGAPDRSLLKRAVFGDDAEPQKVSQEWLKTLVPAGDIDFPDVPGEGGPASVPGLAPRLAKVGLVLEAPSGNGTQKYVVLKDKVQRVSDFTANLLLRAPWSQSLYGSDIPEPIKVSINDITPADGEWMEQRGWPKEPVDQANTQDQGGNKVSCSIYHGRRDPVSKQPMMTMWAYHDYPKDTAQSGSNSYVSPGSGLLFKRFTGSSGGGGNVYLVTDTGLRYSVPATNDSSVTGAAKGEQQQNTAQTRLGYDKALPVPVPAAWADLLAAGPELSSGNAEQAQGS